MLQIEFENAPKFDHPLFPKWPQIGIVHFHIDLWLTKLGPRSMEFLFQPCTSTSSDARDVVVIVEDAWGTSMQDFFKGVGLKIGRLDCSPFWRENMFRNFNRKMIEGYDNPLGFGSFTYQAFTQKIRSWRINMIKYVRQLIPLSHHTCKNDSLNKQHWGSRMVICPTLLKNKQQVWDVEQVGLFSNLGENQEGGHMVKSRIRNGHGICHSHRYRFLVSIYPPVVKILHECWWVTGDFSTDTYPKRA